MNPFIKKALGSILGVIATALVTWLLAKGWLTPDQSEQVIGVLVSIGLIAAQRVWKQKGNAQEMLTAQAMPPGTSMTSVKAAVEAGLAPSVMTKASEVPELKPVQAP